MKPRFKPQYNEAEFGRLAKRVDKYYEEQRRKAIMQDIVNQRNAVLRELSDLRSKPRRTVEEDRRFDELTNRAIELMQSIGALGKKI